MNIPAKSMVYMTGVMPNLWLPSQPQALWLILIFHPTEGRRLWWPNRPTQSHTKTKFLQTVTHLNSNQAWCRVMLLMWPTTLPIKQTATKKRA